MSSVRRTAPALQKLLARFRVGCCFTHSNEAHKVYCSKRLAASAFGASAEWRLFDVSEPPDIRRSRRFDSSWFWLSLCARSQETTSVNPTSLTPSWETQRQAATYSLTIPAPRGQITDRNGVPLAQNRVSNNLSVVFPTPFDFTDRQVVDFVNRAVASARGLTSSPHRVFGRGCSPALPESRRYSVRHCNRSSGRRSGKAAKQASVRPKASSNLRAYLSAGLGCWPDRWIYGSHEPGKHTNPPE